MLLGKQEYPDFEDKSIGLIKWQKAGLENLLGSPCIKRRIGMRAKKEYRIGDHKNSPSSFNFAPTNVHPEIALKVNDYEEKCA